MKGKAHEKTKRRQLPLISKKGSQNRSRSEKYLPIDQIDLISTSSKIDLSKTKITARSSVDHPIKLKKSFLDKNLSTKRSLDLDQMRVLISFLYLLLIWIKHIDQWIKEGKNDRSFTGSHVVASTMLLFVFGKVILQEGKPMNKDL